MSIKENIEKVRSEIREAAVRAGRDPEEILLIAVSKTRTPEEINQAIACGITDIGENKAQEIRDKFSLLDPVNVHMIGHLQTNKVKYIIGKVGLIHSVDSLHLAEEIQRLAEKQNCAVNVLVQVNAAGEEQKSGVSCDEAKALVADILEHCPNITVQGFMHVAPAAEDPEEVRPYFRMVRELFEECKGISHPRLDLKWLSMGMSSDFPVAIEEGANMVRIGSAIFGARDYSKFGI